MTRCCVVRRGLSSGGPAARRLGRCPGDQTVARAELAAVAWAAEAEAAAGRLEAAIDCLAVARGVAALAAGAGSHLLRGPLGDLWRLFARRVAGVAVRWVACVGNITADGAAARVARAFGPTP